MYFEVIVLKIGLIKARSECGWCRIFLDRNLSANRAGFVPGQPFLHTQLVKCQRIHYTPLGSVSMQLTVRQAS